VSSKAQGVDGKPFSAATEEMIVEKVHQLVQRNGRELKLAITLRSC
jgi:hypothetical protein